MQTNKLAQCNASELVQQPIYIAYFPCLVEYPGYLASADQFTKFIDNLKDFQQDICNIFSISWQQIGDEFQPVLHIKYAQDVTNHISTWLRRKPDWFKLVYEVKKDNRYSLALMPDIDDITHLSDGHGFIYWAWSFNPVRPSTIPIKKVFKGQGRVNIAFADYDTGQITKRFNLPIVRHCTLSSSSPLYKQASHYMFKEN